MQTKATNIEDGNAACYFYDCCLSMLSKDRNGDEIQH